MKKIYLFLFFLLGMAMSVSAQDRSFITKWTFDADATSIKFNALTNGSVSYALQVTRGGVLTVVPGSFSSTDANTAQLITISHSFMAGDEVTLTMTSQNLRRFFMGDGDNNRNNLVDVTQWGTVPWTSMENAFRGCSKLNITATDVPDLSRVSDMNSMFEGCAMLNGPENIGSWETENVTDMSYMFSGASSFNGNISIWKTGMLTKMNGMFSNATAFNGDISGWKMESATDMSFMFNGASSFNRDIHRWKMEMVTKMNSMFFNATAFNQNIGGWQTGRVTDMGFMFSGATAFNQNIGAWETGSVTSMEGMFKNASAFNQNLGAWKLNGIKQPVIGGSAYAGLVEMLNNSGLDCGNYSATLAGWYANNPTVTGLTLGASAMKYSVAVGSNQRTNLIKSIAEGGRGWTITGDAPADPATATLVPAGQTITGVEGCATPYADPANLENKIINIDPNGNTTFDYSQHPVTVNNAAFKYYRSTGTVKTVLCRRMYTVGGTGSYMVNGGLVVRVYYDPADINNVGYEEFIRVPTDENPSNTYMKTEGWFISSRTGAADVVGDLHGGSLSSASPISPISTGGTEDGIYYAEFRVTGPGTIGYYGSSGDNIFKNPFITQWQFDAATTSITFNAETLGAVAYSWVASPSNHSGSGTFTAATAGSVTLSGLNIAAGDVVTLALEPANLRRFYMYLSPDAGKLTDVTQWGSVPWASMKDAFNGCSKLNITATDVPDLTLVSDMQATFAGCPILTGPANIGTWNISNVRTTNGMFYGATAFNQNIGSWNTENVSKMSAMFYGASAFNQNIGSWTTANVTEMDGMFSGASAFNQNLGAWKLTGILQEVFEQVILGGITNMLGNSGMDCGNYSATLAGWYAGNPDLRDITLGAEGLQYAAWASDIHNLLVFGSGWTITDGGLSNISPGLAQRVSADETIVGVPTCATPYGYAKDSDRPILTISPNGNIYFSNSNHPVTVSNKFEDFVPFHVSGTSGDVYYEATEGTNKLRVSLRLHSIASKMPITYPTNGGVIVRVYFGGSEPNAIKGDLPRFGWFLSSRQNAHDVVFDMTGAVLANASPITPVEEGEIDGVKYADFKLQTMGTIGYYASNAEAPLRSNFVTQWKFDAASADPIKFKALTNGDVSYTLEIKSGTTSSLTYGIFSTPDANTPGEIAIGPGFNAGDEVTISMEPQNLRRFYMDNGPNKDNLIDVTQWGTTPWTSMQNAFWGCTKLNITASDVPDLSRVESMSYTFNGCSSLTGPANINTWNTEHVTDFGAMFQSATVFNRNVGSWKTFNVTNMERMFYQAAAFNQDLSGWFTGLVKNMSAMFAEATAFNQSLGRWKLDTDVNLISMLDNNGMDCKSYSETLAFWYFYNEDLYGKTLGATGRVYAGIRGVAAHDYFTTNQNWTIIGDSPAPGAPVLVPEGSVGNTDITAPCGTAFVDPDHQERVWLQIDANGNAYDPHEQGNPTTVSVDNTFITGVAGVTTHANGYYEVSSGFTKLRVSRRMHSIHAAGTYSELGGVIVRVYYNPGENNAVANGLGVSGWFKSSQPSSPDVIKGMSPTDLYNAEPITPINLGIEAGINYADFMLQSFGTIGYYAASDDPFRPFETKWKLNGQTTVTFSALTEGEVKYTWTSGNASGTASGEGKFEANNGSVTLTNIGTGTEGETLHIRMEPQHLRQFYNTYETPDGNKLIDLTQWGSVAWTSMESAFYGCENLNITAEDVPNLSEVKSMDNMFNSCFALNGPSNINSWNTGDVTSMSGTFATAAKFDQNIGNWNTRNVTSMAAMFSGAENFNQNIGSWETGLVSDMSNMFQHTTSFNQDISGWKTASVIFMNYMFFNAIAFNQNLGTWKLNANVDLSNMLDYCGMDCSNYSATLQGWYANNAGITGRNMGAAGRRYTTLGLTNGRQKLIADRQWTFNGDVLATGAPILVPNDIAFTAVQGCATSFASPTNGDDKLLGINTNGNNNFQSSDITVTVANAFVASLPSGVTTNDAGFYQANSGANTLRVSRRLHSLKPVVVKSYTNGGGVIVRVYYDPAEITAIKDNNSLPQGSLTLSRSGWFKSSQHTAAGVVGDMSATGLAHATELTPLSSEPQTENSISYVEFKMESFSTIGFYASTSATALPVTLVSFEAKKAENSVLLSWKTTSEVNASHFEVMRSTDAKHWTAIGTVAAKGTSNESLQYVFEDKTAVAGVNYYQLKMVDRATDRMDGSYAMSRVISVNMDGGMLQLYPNPVSHEVNISGLQGGEQLRLMDVSGRVLKNSAAGKTTKAKLNVANLSPGIYLIEIRDAQGQVTVRRFVKE